MRLLMMAQESTNMEFPMPEPYVDADVASRHLSVARKTLSELARKGEVPAYQWGLGNQRRTWRFKLSELDVYMKSKVGLASRPPLPNRRSK
jgi:excisionase family DNA binding protein